MNAHFRLPLFFRFLFTLIRYKVQVLIRILQNYVVDETNEPVDNDKEEEKHRIDHSDKDLADINLPVFLILAPSQGLGDRSHLVVLSESVSVGLDQDIHEGFQEAEDQPAVDHLDVGCLWQICTDAMKNIFFFRNLFVYYKYVSIKLFP